MNNSFSDDFIVFETVTLVPFEPRLINFQMMTSAQIQWLNAYNKRIREKILPLVNRDDLTRDWILSQTQELRKQ